MGISLGSQKCKAAYDPQCKWGLTPANSSAGPRSRVWPLFCTSPLYILCIALFHNCVLIFSLKHIMYLVFFLNIS